MSYLLKTFGDAEQFAVSEEEHRQAEQLVSEIIDMKGEMIGKSQAISKMVDAAKPGIASGVDWTKIITGGGGGEAARQWFALRDRANALYEEAKALLDEWESIFDEKEWDFRVFGIDMARLQGYHRRFVEILAKHREFLGETTEIVQQGSEKVAESKTPQTGIGSGIAKTVSQIGGSVILWGGAALVLFTVVVPALRKKYT